VPIIACLVAAWVVICVVGGIIEKLGLFYIPGVYYKSYHASVSQLTGTVSVSEHIEAARTQHGTCISCLLIIIFIGTGFGIYILLSPYCKAENATCSGQCIPIDNTSVISQCAGLVGNVYCADGTDYNTTYNKIWNTPFGCGGQINLALFNQLICGLTYKYCEGSTVIPYVCPQTCADLTIEYHGNISGTTCSAGGPCDNLNIYGTNKACS